MTKKKCFDCIIVGGGAAGMMAAITAARKGFDCLIIEHSKRIGNKILQTGNGKCNFTNLNMSEEMYQNNDKDFVMSVIDKFNVEKVLFFFRGLGVFYKERNGYVYPHSETAASLQEALRLELERLGVEIVCECEIRQLLKKENEFVADTSCGTFKAHRLILATGSKAAPKTGSDGSGYALAKAFGHKIKKPLPALVQLISSSRQCKAMAGVRSTGRIELYADGDFVCSDEGEIQYTDYGVSGIPVFQISRFAVEAVDSKKNVFVRIDMLPDVSHKELEDDYRRRIKTDGSRNIEQFYAGILNKKLVNAAAKYLNIDINKPVCNYSERDFNRLIKQFKAFEMEITDFKGFENGQICQGGVRLADINADTMESKLCEGLFFAGEIVDVDGKCGGYNLQWAWSSGFVAGNSLKL